MRQRVSGGVPGGLRKRQPSTKHQGEWVCFNCVAVMHADAVCCLTSLMNWQRPYPIIDLQEGCIIHWGAQDGLLTGVEDRVGNHRAVEDIRSMDMSLASQNGGSSRIAYRTSTCHAMKHKSLYIFTLAGV